MTYCSKCGVQNPEEAKFCNDCGTTLRGRPRKKDPGSECEDECSKGSGGFSWFWAAIVIVIGLWLIFEFGIKNIVNESDLPSWLNNCEFWWIIPVIIGVAIIVAGVRGLTKRR
jgi:uncharacterized membrane protein YvbJ